MTGIIHSAQEPGRTEAVEELRNGNCVIFPTETVYGLGANAYDEHAVARIFALKGRPSDNPLIVHVGSKDQILQFATIQNPIEQLLIDKLMPGPFTLLLQKKSHIPNIVTAGHELVGVRMPDHFLAQQFLCDCGVPVAAPSANPSGKPSPSNANMALHYFEGRIDRIIDGGPCPIGIESTVVKVSLNDNSSILNSQFSIDILRPGFITKEDIESVVGPDIPVTYAEAGPIQAPGMKYTHYAPRAKVIIVDRFDPEEIRKLVASGKKVGILASRRTLAEYFQIKRDLYPGDVRVFERGNFDNPLWLASKLYEFYHTADKLERDILLVEKLPEEGVYYAIMNRVRKSASA